MIMTLHLEQMELPPKVKNLHGLVFHELKVQTFVRLEKTGAIWSCKCTCGKEVEVRASDLKSGNTKSCGCRRSRVAGIKSLKHGQTSKKHHTEYSKIYKTWRSMLNRCHTISSSSYLNYGGRGITVCDEWRESFEAFYKDMGEPPEQYTLERVDVNRGYEKNNCKWIPISDQVKNKRNTVRVILSGEKMIQADAARRLGIHPSNLCDWHKGRTKMPAHIDLVFIENLQSITTP